MTPVTDLSASHVTVQTKIRRHLYVWLATIAAKRTLTRADVYQYALRFAEQSGSEFLAYLDRMIEKKTPGPG